MRMEDLVAKAVPEIQRAFRDIRSSMFKSFRRLDERLDTSMMSYYLNDRGFVWIEIGRKRLRVHLRKGHYIDTLGKIKPKPGWGGYPELSLGKEDLDAAGIAYLLDLMKQASTK